MESDPDTVILESNIILKVSHRTLFVLKLYHDVMNSRYENKNPEFKENNIDPANGRLFYHVFYIFLNVFLNITVNKNKLHYS